MLGSEFIWRPWGELHKAIVSGSSAFEHVFEASFFEYVSAHPPEAELFNAGMTSFSAIDAAAVVAAYDFSCFEKIVDVGGGRGGLMHTILSANPQLHGVLFDLPDVVAGAVALRAEALAARCEMTQNPESMPVVS
jgi:16S rRNA G1207 methylase RsmC